MLSNEEVFGAQGASHESVFPPEDKTAVPDTPWQNIRSVLGEAAKNLGKAAAAGADMFLGVPGQALGVGADIGARAAAFGSGESRRIQEEAGAAAKEHVPAQVERFLRMAPGGLTKPIQTIIEKLTGEKELDQSIVTKAIDKVAEGVDKATRGYVSAADAKSLLDAAMLAGGARGTDLAVEAGLAKKTPSGKEARASYAGEEIPHDEVFKADLSSIPDPVIVTPKILKQIFADAKSPTNAVDNLFNAAKEGKLPPPKGQEVHPLTEIEELLAREPADRTAIDRMKLEEWRKIGMQGGFSDPAHLAKIAALTGLGIAGVNYLKDEHPGVLKEFRRRVRSMLGMEDEDRKLRDRDADRQRFINDENQKFEDRLNNGFEPPVEKNQDGNVFAAEDILGPLGVGMAVKGKGGMWHPEAVSRLAAPFGNKTRAIAVAEQDAAGGTVAPAVRAAAEQDARMSDWGTNAVQRYLNRHAGTEGDPLKDVEVPFGEGVKRWEELMDKSVATVPGETVPGGKPGERIYDFRSNAKGGAARAQALAIENYLSHVGDFLRQNVDPVKLGQYDLVRAVKETAANDARVAKEMEKAAGDSTKELPLHKEYPDGTSWRRIELPEKLTPTQAKMVRRTKASDKFNADRYEDGDSTPGDLWIAVDKDNKPIVNSYTQDGAVGRTPEEAWLAGELAKEGNQLGHCVGGYCDAVASGESKIYSLRDAKGKSHVTVEVSPPDVRVPHNSPEQFARMKGGELLERYNEAKKGMNEVDLNREIIQSPEYRAWLAERPSDVVQIKGKQNRAPASTYLPYVQDFVRSGKWGEVGDLEGTGLIRGRNVRGHTSSQGYATTAGDLKNAGLEPEKFYTAAEVRELADKTAKARGSSERGSVDPALLTRIAAVALGATVGASVSDNKLLGAVIGGVGLGAATRLNAKGAAAAIKNAFAADSRIRINHLADAHDAGMARAARAIWQQASAVAELAPKAEDRVAITHAIQNGREVPTALRPALQKARDFFGAMAQAGQDSGVLKGLIDNYVTNLWDLTGKNKSKWEEILGHAGGPSMSPESRFALKRKIQNLEEGKALGLVPQTEDVAQIMSIYGNSLARSMENKKMLGALKSVVDPTTGTKLLLPSNKAPHSYETIDHPQMSGIRVHPDIAPSMKFIFDNSDPGVVSAGLQGLNTAIKRSAVSFSLFHAKALVDAQIGAHGMLRGVPKAVKALGQAAAPKIFGENSFLKQMREGGAGDIIDKAQTAGLKVSMEKGKLADEDLNGSFYTALKSVQQGLDSIVPGMGLPVKAITAVNHAVDIFMWERLHAGMKLGTFAEKLEVLRNSDAKAAVREGRPPKPEEDLAQQAASFTNDIYGGLNWRKLAEEAKTKWGRDVALAAYSPKGRRVLQLLVFAPDWTLSTTRAATRAFGKAFGYEEGSGVRGLLEPQNATDLHRQYMLRSAAYYALVGDGINYALSGHHLWDNKDPTMIDMGDGRTMQWSKHSMEPIHWVTKPGQQALNKLAFFPKEAANQMLGTEYLSAAGMAPRMDTSPGGRLVHVGKSLMPIAGQQAFGEKSSQGGAVAGFLGAPIYGKTFEERQAAKAERQRKRVLDQIEKRQREPK